MLSGPEQRASTGIQLSLLNSIPNIFWSVLCILPVYLFCSHSMTLVLLYTFGGISLVPYFLPVSILDRMGVSSSPATYRRLGVGLVNRFTQDGILVRKFARRSHPNRSRLADPKVIAGLRSAAFQRERFHLAGFLFFLLVTGRAIWLGQWYWTLLLLTSNIVYNAYPVLLQQYIRLRLRRISRQLDHL
jgi:Glycosyl-4,4'-diaponeurosporenoate acyltransferase